MCIRHAVLPLILIVSTASPVAAGMKKDIADCEAANRKSSAKACTRVLKSGRLPRSQHYIGYLNRAWAYRLAGDNKKALSDLNRVAKLKPKFAKMYYSRALVLCDLGQTQDALADLDRYIELNSRNANAFVNRALVLRKLNKFDRGLADVDQAIKLKPKSSKTRVLRALLLSDLGRNKDALEQVNSVISDKPKKAEAYYVRGLIQFRQKNYPASLKNAEKTLALKSKFTAAKTLKGQVLEAQGQSGPAKAAYKTAIRTSAKFLDGESAQKIARKRISALDRVVFLPAKKETARKPEKKTEARNVEKPSCLRFVPSAGTTIEVPCN